METFPMGGTAEAHFSQQQQQQPPPSRQQQQQWPSQLLPPGPPQSSAPFPSPPASSISDHGQHYSPFYGSNSASDNRQSSGIPRNSQQLSLNMSGLNVAPPGTLSPISASTSTAMSPATPISPAGNNNHFSHHPPQNMMFPASDHTHSPYDTEPPSSATLPHLRHPIATTSRSSSVSSSSLPPSRKRSFTSINTQSSSTTTSSSAAAPTSATLFEEVSPSFGGDESRGSTPMDLGYDDGHHPSSTDVSTDEIETEGRRGSGKPHSSARSASAPQNNFVSKLYAMITDPKAAQFIVWTELGTSFVVSNVGEFSRSVLGSHFKHNNFSSFVRQLNMYGFHKINRTPRAQRTSSDAQTWEFSHYKFLRGRPDLLDEIKRKALEPDPSVKQRIELPGEVAAQLGNMRDENRRMWDQLSAEKRKVDKLVGVVARLWDVVDKGFGPGSVPSFPAELFDTLDSPNIYVTSPSAMTSHHYPPPPPLNIPLNNVSGGGLHSAGISPGVSPTTPEFANHHHHPQAHMHQQQQQPHPLSRRTSYTNMSSNGSGWRSNEQGTSPGNESPMEFFEDVGGRVKRQRMSDEAVDMLNSADSGAVVGSKRSSRSRSDSAPYAVGPAAAGISGGVGGGGGGGWGMSRPRSGSGFQAQQQQQQQQRSLPSLSNGAGGRMGPGGGGGQIAVPSNPPMIR